MRGFRILGEYILEIVVVTLLVAISVATVVMFIPMMVGLNGFFKNKKEDRLFKDIFTTIGENWKILIPFTIFELVIMVFPILNIYFFNTHPENMNYIVLAVSYVALVIGVIYFVTAPTIIVNMYVGFGQLLRNGFMLLFGSLVRSIVALLVVAGVVAMIVLYPYAVVATLYVVPFVVTRLMLENFYTLKARALDTNVYELKKQESADDYFDENYQVKHPEETEGNNEKD